MTIRLRALALLFALTASSAHGQSPRADRPQTPMPPFPYQAEDVAYANRKSPGVDLAGTLTLPSGKGPFPAVVLITGSGAQDRDETLVGHKPFLLLADALTRRGVAVLRVDDRGVGGSTGASPSNTSADFATDVEAGVAFLRSRPDIDGRRIGLLGHSEGGVIGPMVAQKDPSIAFVVMLAGPALPGREIIASQARDLALASGATAEAAQSIYQLQDHILQAVIGAPDDAALVQRVNEVMRTAGQRPPPPAQLQALGSPWYRYFITYDPAPALRSLKVPVLALVGSKDVQVPASANIPALKAALAGNRRAEVVELAGLNHLFQTAGSGSPAEYAAISETMAPSALGLIVDWVARTAKAKAP
jgi:uncharacterized protein